jgi:hypothetical protein
MDRSRLGDVFCWLLLGVMPASMLGANSGAAMLYAQGTAWRNGASVPGTSAVFPGDLVQTKADAMVQINATGSSVMIFSDSLVKYEGDRVSLEHGTVRVATTQGMSIQAGEVAVQPARANDATDFDVSDVDGTVHITARKGDVSVSTGTETARLAQGEQTTREDRDDTQKPKKKRRGGGAVPAAGGPLLDSPYALAIGVTAVGVPLAWVLSQGDDPLSPVEP